MPKHCFLSSSHRFTGPWILTLCSVTSGQGTKMLLSGSPQVLAFTAVIQDRCQHCLCISETTGLKVFNYISQAHTDTTLRIWIHVLISLYPKHIHILYHTRFVWSQHLLLQQHSYLETICRCRRLKRCGFDPWVRKNPWKRAQQCILVFLTGESPRTREPGRLQSYNPWGCRVEHDWACTYAHAHTHTFVKLLWKCFWNWNFSCAYMVFRKHVSVFWVLMTINLHLMGSFWVWCWRYNILKEKILLSLYFNRPKKLSFSVRNRWRKQYQ